MPKPGAKYDNDLRVLERRKVVASLYLQGKNQTEIGEIVKVAQTQVSDDIKIIRKMWLSEIVQNYDEKVAIELAGIEQNIDQLYQAWVRSCGMEEVKTHSVDKVRSVQTEDDDTKSKKKRGSVSDMIPIKESTKVQSKQLIGDPRYMAEITRLRELRCKLLGILKPDEKHITNQINVLPPEFWEKMDQGAAIHVTSIDDEIEKVKALALPTSESTPTEIKPFSNGDTHQ